MVRCMGCHDELAPGAPVDHWPPPDGPAWHEGCLICWDEDSDYDDDDDPQPPRTNGTDAWVRWLCRRCPVDARTWPRDWAGPPVLHPHRGILAIWPRLKLAAEEEAARCRVQTEALSKLAQVIQDALGPPDKDIEPLPLIGICERRDCRILQDTASAAMRAGRDWVPLWYALAEVSCGSWFDELGQMLITLRSKESLGRSQIKLADARGFSVWADGFFAGIRKARDAGRYWARPEPPTTLLNLHAGTEMRRRLQLEQEANRAFGLLWSGFLRFPSRRRRRRRTTTPIERTETQKRSLVEREAHRAFGQLWRRILGAWETAERGRLQWEQALAYHRMVLPRRRGTPSASPSPGALPPQPPLHGHHVFDLRILIHGLQILHADGWLPRSPADAAWVGLLLPALRVHGRRVTAFEILDEHLGDRLRELDPAAFGRSARAVQQSLGADLPSSDRASVLLCHPAIRGRFALWHWPRTAEAALLAKAQLLHWLTGIPHHAARQG